MEDELVAWLRAHKYQPGQNDATTSKASAQRLLAKGPNRRVWEFLLAHAKPRDEASSILADSLAAREGGFRDAGDVREAKQRAALRQQVQKQAEQNKAMQEALERQMAHLQSRLADTVAEQGLREQKHQAAQAVEVQMHAAACCRAQLLKSLESLTQLHSRLQQAVSAAREWAGAAGSRQPGVQGPSRDHSQQLLLAKVVDACASVRAELQARAVQAMQQGRLSHQEASASASAPILLCPAASGGRPVEALCASPAPPLATLQAVIEVMQEATHALRAQCEAGQREGQGGQEGSEWGGEASSTGPDPRQLLRQRQQAHVDRFLATETVLNAAHEITHAMKERGPAARQVLAWPYNSLKLQEAWLAAELAALREEAARLTAERAGRHEAEAALQEQWAGVYASSCYAEQAHALLEALARESRGVIMRWEQEGAAHRAWAHGVLAPAADAAVACCASAHDCVQAEMRAAGRYSTAGCAPRRALGPPPPLPQPPPSPGHGVDAWQGREGHRRGPAPPVLFCYRQALPAAAAAVRRGAGAAREEGAQGGGAASTPVSLSLSSTPTKAGAGPASAGVPPLALVLHAACTVDALAPLRCPAGLVCSAAGQHALRELQQQWLLRTKPWLQRAAEQAQGRAAAVGPLRTQVRQLTHPEKDDRLECVRRYVVTAQRMQEYARTSVGRALLDWKTLPAVHLLPDVQYAGLTASEWLSAVQALLSSIREASGTS